MSDALSCTEIEQQRVELLPARTVLSLFAASVGSVCPATSQAGGAAGFGGNGTGALANLLGIPVTVGGATGNSGAPTSEAAC